MLRAAWRESKWRVVIATIPRSRGSVLWLPWPSFHWQWNKDQPGLFPSLAFLWQWGRMPHPLLESNLKLILLVWWLWPFVHIKSYASEFILSSLFLSDNGCRLYIHPVHPHMWICGMQQKSWASQAAYIKSITVWGLVLCDIITELLSTGSMSLLFIEESQTWKEVSWRTHKSKSFLQQNLQMWMRAYAVSHFLSHDIASLFLSLKVIYWHSTAYYCIMPKAYLSQSCSSTNTLLQQTTPVWNGCQWFRHGIGSPSP